MDVAVTAIPMQGLVLAFVPTAIVIGIIFRWTAGAPTAMYATIRMLIQLLLIGYVLGYIFETDQAGLLGLAILES